MRLDLDLPVGEKLGDHCREQMIVGFENLDRRSSLQSRRQVGEPARPRQTENVATSAECAFRRLARR